MKDITIDDTNYNSLLFQILESSAWLNNVAEMYRHYLIGLDFFDLLLASVPVKLLG